MRDDKLQEIIELLPYSIRYSGEIEELLDYAKEQAERVEELEDYKSILQLNLNLVLKEKQRLEQQNKRYKQALEEISNAEWNSEGLDAERELDKVTDVAFKALEESK